MHFHKSQRHCEVIAFQFHANFHTPRILYVQYAHFSMHAYYSHTFTGRRHCQTSAIQFYANSHTRCIAFSTLVDQNGGTPNRATHVTQNILHGLPGNNANFTIHSNLWTWDLGWHDIWTALYIKCHIFVNDFTYSGSKHVSHWQILIQNQHVNCTLYIFMMQTATFM